jgi:hypothetical protein
MLAALVRHPVRSAALSGILITLIVTFVSFPRSETLERTVAGWAAPGFATSGPVRDELLSSYERGGGEAIVELSEAELRDRSPALAAAVPILSEDGRKALVRYLGKDSTVSETIYAAERTINIGPWWSPNRFLYRAVDVQVDSVGRALRLTYERDLQGLIALLLIDTIVGFAYGAVIGLILAVLGLEGLEQRRLAPQLPRPSLPPSAPPGRRYSRDSSRA